MNLEEALNALTAAITALTATVRSGPQAPVASATKASVPHFPSAAPAPFPAMPFEPPVQTFPSEATLAVLGTAAIPLDYATAQSRLALVAQRLGQPGPVIALMQKYGAARLSDINPMYYAQLVAEAEAVK